MRTLIVFLLVLLGQVVVTPVRASGDEIAVGSIIGILLGVVAVFIVVGIVLGCIVWRQHRALRRQNDNDGQLHTDTITIAMAPGAEMEGNQPLEDREGEEEGEGAVTVTSLSGVPIENRVRPRQHLPRGAVQVQHEDQMITIDFKQITDVPQADPPPLTEEELRKLEDAKNRVASPEFYGRAEYAERHASAPNSPELFYGSFSSIKQIAQRYAGSYAGSTGSVMSQSFNFGARPGSPSRDHHTSNNNNNNNNAGGGAATKTSSSLKQKGKSPHKENFDILDSTSDEFDDTADPADGSQQHSAGGGAGGKKARQQRRRPWPRGVSNGSFGRMHFVENDLPPHMMKDAMPNGNNSDSGYAAGDGGGTSASYTNATGPAIIAAIPPHGQQHPNTRSALAQPVPQRRPLSIDTPANTYSSPSAGSRMSGSPVSYSTPRESSHAVDTFYQDPRATQQPPPPDASGSFASPVNRASTPPPGSEKESD